MLVELEALLEESVLLDITMAVYSIDGGVDIMLQSERAQSKFAIFIWDAH